MKSGMFKKFFQVGLKVLKKINLICEALTEDATRTITVSTIGMVLTKFLYGIFKRVLAA